MHALAVPALAQQETGDPEQAASQSAEPNSQMRPAPDRPSETPYPDEHEDGGFGLDEFDIGLRWLAPASIDGGNGDVSLTRFGSALSFEYEFENEIELSFGGEYLREDWSYDGQGSGLLPGVNRPWDGFERYGFELGATAPLGEWEIFTELGFEWAEEVNAATSDSLLLEGFVAGRRQIWDNFDLVLGVFYGESLESEDDILPLIGFDWRISDKDMLSLSRPREGYQLMYRRGLNDQWTLNTYGRVVNEEFRLSNNGVTNGGAIASDEFQIGTGVDYQVGPGRAGIDLGYSFARTYEVFDSNGNTVSKPELGGALSVGVAYTIGF